MLDTGLRANEIISLDIGDLDIETGAVHVRHGKGDQKRTVFLGSRSRREYLRYLRFRSGELSDNEPIWLSLKGDNVGKRLKYSGLRQILQRRSENARVATPTAHDFRRAFAITYLRNGGDIFTLRHLLGHKTLEMVMRYLAIAKVDLGNAHRKASPADSM
jgi:site-specific recombinase XerD